MLNVDNFRKNKAISKEKYGISIDNDQGTLQSKQDFSMTHLVYMLVEHLNTIIEESKIEE